MAKKTYIKIIINLPDRDMFSHLQHNILFEDVEMFYFPKIKDLDEFVNRIRPNVFLTYIDTKTLAEKEFLELFRSSLSHDIWTIFILSSKISYEQIKELGEFERSMIFQENVNPEVIAYNVKSIIKQEKLDLEQNTNRNFFQNLLESSKIINQERSVNTLFEKLINYLPKVLPYDYWAVYTFDPETSSVSNFVQFIPPQRRNSAVLTPNFEKLAEIWLKRTKGFQISISKDPQLFRKLGEWGWGIKQMFFAPLIVENLAVGGLIIGNINQTEIPKHDAKFLVEITRLLAQKIYNIFRSEKIERGLDDFAEQLIFNRFSEDSILQLSCKKMNEVAKAQSSIFWQVNRGFGFLFPKFSYSRENSGKWRDLEKNLIFLNKDKYLNRIVSREKTFLLKNISENGHFDEATVKVFKKLGYHNLLITPLRIHTDEVGVFISNRGENEDGFGAWEVDQITVLMQKVQKVLEDTHIVKEANLKLKQLSRIFELGNEIKLELNLEDILARILNSIRKTLGWNDVAILRSNQFKRYYKMLSKVGFDSTSGLPLAITENISFADFDNFLGSCVKISHSHFYDSHPVNISGGSSGFPDEIQAEWHGEDLLLVPIETRKKLHGFFVVRDPVDRLKPNKDRIVSLEYFANQAAVAIDNSTLYENLLASEERYRSLAETMTLALVTCSPDGKIVYVNPAFENLVGLDKISLSRQEIKKFLTKESQTKLQEISRILMTAESDSKHIENEELELVSRNKENIPVSTFAFPFYQQRHKIGFFLVLNDLRVIKKLERLKSDFNSMIVHDLRSPMNVIQGFIELIRTRVVGEINTEQEELLDIAKENVKKVLSLVDNFLVASKMEVGKFNIEPKVSEIHSLIERVLENHQVLMKNKNITLESKLNDNLPLLYFDNLRLEQVLNNLLSNALKFTPEGGKIRVTTDFYQKKMKGEDKMFARVGVHDTGPGIPEDKIKNVFEKYEQAESGLALKSAGTGLGLSICKEIVGLHGGDIWVESEIKKGSKFYFTLPIEPSIDKFLK